MSKAEDITLSIIVAVEPPKMLAIMRGVRFGLNDQGHVGLSFGAYVAEGLGAPLFIHYAPAADFIDAYKVGDTSRLEGKPCWVTAVNGALVLHSPCLI